METKKASQLISNIFKTPLLRNFFIISLVVSLIFPICSVFLIIPSFNNQLTINTENEALRAATHLSSMFVKENIELKKGSLSRKTIDELELVKRDFRLEKLKVFSKQGETIFSTNPKDIGKINKNEVFYNIVAKGKVYSEVIEKHTKSLEGRTLMFDVVETYVPIMLNGTYAGAFEIYYDITSRKEKLTNLLARTYGILFGIALILLITVVVILFKASKNVIERDWAEEALRKAHEGLEKRVAERTVDLEETNIKLLTEIRERGETEKNLRQSEERYRVLVETSADAIISANEEMEIIQWNYAASRVFGYLEEDIMGEPISILVPEKYKNAHMEGFNRFLETNSAKIIGKSVELEGRRKDGTIVPIELSISAYKRESSWIFTSIIRDTTARKRAAELLELASKQWQNTFDAIRDMIVIVNKDRQIAQINQAAKEAFPDLGIGTQKLCYEIFHGVRVLPEGCVSCDVFETGQPAVSEYYDPRLKKWFNLYAYQIDNPGGEVEQVVHVFKDITQQKRESAEKEEFALRLQRSEKMEAMGTLAGGVAHDLNNLLGGIVGYPELMLMDLPEDSKLRKPIMAIQKSGQKATAVVQDLLTLARRGVVVNEVVNLNEIIAEYLKSPEFESLETYHPDIQIQTSLKGDLLNILGSPVHLSKTVMNLVSNAAEAIYESGMVGIATDHRYIDKPVRGYDKLEEGNYVILEVIDDGIGISAEHIDRIFEPFYTKKKMGRSGTGLGMAVVWGTVKDHKGYIDIQSAVGKGTTFTLYFPVTRKEVMERITTGSIEDYRGNGESILVVDDVEEQRELASGMLKKLGYSISTVSSGEEAAEYLKKNKVDLILLDMIMDPGIDGLETYEQILEMYPEQKVIIASGFSETERVTEAQRLGAGAYVKKPFLLEKIGLAVKEELEK
jgi:PAS domain S-box-containing protein